MKSNLLLFISNLIYIIQINIIAVIQMGDLQTKQELFQVGMNALDKGKLKLYKKNIGDQQIRVVLEMTLTEGSILNDLKLLNLSSNRIGDKGAKYLSNGNFTNLTVLILEGNMIGNEGARSLSNSSFNLKSLLVSNNQIKDEGAEHIMNGNTNSLQCMHVYKNAMSSLGSFFVLNAGFDSMEGLWLSFGSSEKMFLQAQNLIKSFKVRNKEGTLIQILV